MDCSVLTGFPLVLHLLLGTLFDTFGNYLKIVVIDRAGAPFRSFPEEVLYKSLNDWMHDESPVAVGAHTRMLSHPLSFHRQLTDGVDVQCCQPGWLMELLFTISFCFCSIQQIPVGLFRSRLTVSWSVLGRMEEAARHTTRSVSSIVTQDLLSQGPMESTLVNTSAITRAPGFHQTSLQAASVSKTSSVSSVSCGLCGLIFS